MCVLCPVLPVYGGYCFWPAQQLFLSITRLVMVIQPPLARAVIKEWILHPSQGPLLLIWGFSGSDGDILPFLSVDEVGSFLRPHSPIRLFSSFWDNEAKTQRGKGLCQLCLTIPGDVHVSQLICPLLLVKKNPDWYMMHRTSSVLFFLRQSLIY